MELAKGITLMLDRIGLQVLDEFLGGLAERFARGGHYVPIENAC